MQSQGNNMAGFLAFVVLAALGLGAFFFFQDAYQYLQGLDRQVTASLVVILITVLYIGLSIRKAGQVHGLQRFQLEKKAECYQRFLRAWSNAAVKAIDDGSAQTVSNELDAASEQITLWASPGVIKQLVALRNTQSSEISDDLTACTVLAPILLAMRSDLGQHNLGLNEGDLANLGFARRVRQDTDRIGC